MFKKNFKNYVDYSFTEENLRETIKKELSKIGKETIFKDLGLEWDRWDGKWKVNSYGKFERILNNYKSPIETIGLQVIGDILMKLHQKMFFLH